MPATLILTAIYGDMLLAAAALGAFGLAAATFAIRLVATTVITSLIAKRNAPSGGGNGVQQIGARVQLPPATDNKIGVVYGSAFMKPIIIDAKISEDQQTMWYVLVWSEAMDNDTIGTFSFGDVYWGDKLLNFDSEDATKVISWTNSDGTDDDKVNGKIHVYHYRDGSTKPTNTTDNAYAILADSTISSEYRWDSNKKMTGLVFSIVKLDYDRDAGVTGLPEISCEVTNSLTKPGAVIKDYLKNTRYGASLSDAKIDLTSLSVLDAYSDETISFTPSGGGAAQTTSRYRINGPVDTTKNFLDNLLDICESCDTWLKWDETNNKWSVAPNRSYLDLDPTSANIRQINSSNIVGGIDISPIDLNSTYNSVEVQFPNTKVKDQPGYHIIDITEFPNVVRNANEPDNRLVVALPYTNNIVQAQYVAARRMLQSREDLVVTFTMDYSGIQIDSGDVVGIHHERYGWGEYNELVSQPYGKLFRVTQVQEGKDGNGNLYARIVASEYNDGVYDDDNIELSDFTPELNTGISDPTIITTPNAPAISNVNSQGNVPNFTVSVDVPTTGTTLGLEFWYGTADSLETGDYKIWSVESPVGQSQFTKGSEVSIVVSGLPADTYYWRARAVGARTKSGFSNSVSIVWDPSFISGVVGQDVVVNFFPPIVGVPRVGPSLVPVYEDAILKAYGQAGGGLVPYVNALTDDDPLFTSSTWRIATTAFNNYNTASIVTLQNISFTLTNITTTTDGGVQFPAPNAMNSTTAFVSIPVRFKDAAGNVFNSPPTSAQLLFVDQGSQGPAGEDGINPGFIDLSISGGSFRLGTDSFFTPATMDIQVIEQNILNPIPLWTVTGASYIESTNSFTNDTITITPYTTSTIVDVVVSVDLYSKRIQIPIVRDGAQGVQGIDGSFAGRGFIPLAYVPIDVDPTLASQSELTAAWTSATTYSPVLNDGGTFWYVESIPDGLGGFTYNNITENFSWNGTQWIAAVIQISGNLIADGTITGNQINANSIFTNRLASTNNVDDFGTNTGPGYWLDGSNGDAYFGGDVTIGDNLRVGGLIEASVLVASVVDTNELVPGAVTEVVVDSYEGAKYLPTSTNRFDPVVPLEDWIGTGTNGQQKIGTPIFPIGTRATPLPDGVSIIPQISSVNGGRIYLNASMTYYNDTSDNKNLIEVWRRGNVISNRKYKAISIEFNTNNIENTMYIGQPDPLNQNQYLYLENSNTWDNGTQAVFGDILNPSTVWNVCHTYVLDAQAGSTPKYWLFGNGGATADISITTATANAFFASGTLPTVNYDTVKVYSTSTLWTNGAEITDNITALAAFDVLFGSDTFTEGREIFIGDSKGRIFWTKESKLPKVFCDLGNQYTDSAQINDFCLASYLPSGTFGEYKVIAVGNNGRILTSARDYRNWRTDSFPTTPGTVNDYAPGEFTWSEQTFGNYNLLSVASDYNPYNTTDPVTDNGRYVVAVGEFGTILYSSNYGVTFTKVTSGTYEKLTSVSAIPYTNAVTAYRWVITGETGTILRSTNGIDWNSDMNLPAEETYQPEGSTGTVQTYTPDMLSSAWSKRDTRFILGGDDRVIVPSLGTSTTVTSVLSNLAETTSSWVRIFNIGSNVDPFNTSTPTEGNRLTAPQSSINVTIADANYRADAANSLTYTYYLLAGHSTGTNISQNITTGAFGTNAFLSATEFKR